jgi:uncharacterized membrane protein required for colicin V production
MVWILALLCLGLVGLAGYHRGPIRAAFSLLGLLAGVWLAQPLSPLASHLLPVLGFHDPIWQLFLPGVIAFLGVLVIFKIVGNVFHQKITVHFQHQMEQYHFFRWERLYHRLGFCVGVLNGAVYFFLLLLPVYIAGYFTAEAADANAPAGLRLVTYLRAELLDSRLDCVVAAYDPIPPSLYQAADIIDLLLHNPSLIRRLAHYPPLLLRSVLEEKDIASDAAPPPMSQTQAAISDLLKQPKNAGFDGSLNLALEVSGLLRQPRIHTLITNAAVPGRIGGPAQDDLEDLWSYLNAGKSPKYDSTNLLGIWNIDVHATVAGERRRHPDLLPKQIATWRTNWVPLIAGFSLLATPDNQIVLRHPNPAKPKTTMEEQGTWTNAKAGNSYEVAVPNNDSAAETVPVTVGDDGALQFPRAVQGDVRMLIFNKQR